MRVYTCAFRSALRCGRR